MALAEAGAWVLKSVGQPSAVPARRPGGFRLRSKARPSCARRTAGRLSPHLAGSFSIDPSTGNRLTLFSRRSRAWRRLFFLQPLLLLGVLLRQLLCLLLVTLLDLLPPGFICILSCKLLVLPVLLLLKFLPVSFLLRV